MSLQYIESASLFHVWRVHITRFCHLMPRVQKAKAHSLHNVNLWTFAIRSVTGPAKHWLHNESHIRPRVWRVYPCVALKGTIYYGMCCLEYCTFIFMQCLLVAFIQTGNFEPLGKQSVNHIPNTDQRKTRQRKSRVGTHWQNIWLIFINFASW